MTHLPLVIAPDPRLSIASMPVEKVDDEIRQLMDDMLETMYKEEGIGLAAVQVGVHKRVLVMDLFDKAGRYDSEGKRQMEPNPIYMANPEIIYKSEEQNEYEEGCLSFPEQRALVVRPKQVKIKYLDYNGDEQIMECDELLATCVQHEIDHLNGVVFVDHVSKLKRDMIIKKVQKMKKLYNM